MRMTDARIPRPVLIRRRVLLAVVTVLGAIAISGTVRAEYRELDAIVAIVESDVVLASELLERLKNIKEQYSQSEGQLPPNDVLISQIMERLIIENLQLQEAERRGVTVDDESLTRAVGGFADQNKLSIEEFARALEADGMSYIEFREQIRREMLMQRLRRSLVNRRVNISEQDIEDLLNAPYYQKLLSDEYRVGHILLLIADERDESVVDAAETEAIQIVTDLRAGADFAQMAISKSAGSRALEGGDLGWRKAPELPTLFATEVLALKAGETAVPIRSGSGIHIVQLLEQRGAGVQEEQQSLARHILVQPSEIRTEAETEALIREIHGKLMAGEDFAALAIEFSEDPSNALNGGSLGWTSGRDFVAAFRDVLATTEVGVVSEPFKTRYGWHVLEVLDRRVEDLSQEARRSMAVEILHERRFEEETEKWLQELRDEAFVEIRL